MSTVGISMEIERRLPVAGVRRGVRQEVTNGFRVPFRVMKMF